MLNSLVNRRGRCRIRVLAGIHRCRHLTRMLGNNLAATIDVVLYLRTTCSHCLLTPLYIVAKLVLAGVYVGVDLCRCFSRLLLEVLSAFTRALSECFACICSRLGSIKDADRRANSEAYQKPTETTSA